MPHAGWQRRFELQRWAEDHLYDTQVPKPEDWPSEHRLPTCGVSPTYCGEHAPGLTGLYGLLNGLKLLMAPHAPLRPADERELLEVGWRFMSGREALAPHRGMRRGTLVRLAEAMTFALSRIRGQWTQCELTERRARRDSAGTGATLEKAVVSGRVPLVLLGKGQYSALRGYTPASWLLFDAAGRQWVQRTKKGVAWTPTLIVSLWRPG
jgi:hypothetical protein